MTRRHRTVGTAGWLAGMIWTAPTLAEAGDSPRSTSTEPSPTAVLMIPESTSAARPFPRTTNWKATGHSRPTAP